MVKKEEQTAKILFNASFTGQDFDASKMRNNISSLKKLHPRNTIEILKSYLHLLKEHLRKSTLLIESPEKLSPKIINRLSKHFTRSLKRRITVDTKENKSLIGGFKLTLGDDQWDYSIKQKLNNIRESING